MQQFLILYSLLLLLVLPVSAQEKDQSIQLEGSAYTLHKVLAGETLFAISKKYQVSIEDLKQANNLEDGASIALDRLLIIPLSNDLQKEEKKEIKQTSTAYFTHKVVQGESLYSIARAYENVHAKQIKLMNGLESDTLKIGMLLEIPRNVEDIHKETVRIESSLKERKQDSITQIDTRALFTTDSVETEVDSSALPSMDDTYEKRILRAYQEIFENIDALASTIEIERGIGTWMESYTSENKKQFFALHGSATLGTVLKIRNLMNNRVVYVKVIGKLPRLNSSEKNIIKISEAAAQFLNILDKKFLVEIIQKKEINR